MGKKPRHRGGFCQERECNFPWKTTNYGRPLHAMVLSICNWLLTQFDLAWPNCDPVLSPAAYKGFYKLSHCKSLAGFDGKIRYNHPLK